MGDNDVMPKITIDQAKEARLKQSQIDYMRIIEQKNLERVLKLQRTRRNNLITGSVIGCGVLGIYMYSMFAIKQESFLDDFEEPKTVHN